MIRSSRGAALMLGAALIVFSTVAFSVLITLNVAYFLGMTLNVLTLMGLAMGFGLVVDNAIVVLENIFRRRKLGDSAAEAAEKGSREVFLAIVAATGTTVIVVVPFVYLQGDLRVYYVPLAIVVGIALIASMFVAFTFIPALGARLLAWAGGADKSLRRLPFGAGWTAQRDLPAPEGRTFRDLYAGRARRGAGEYQ
jgi:multidrug efflux pump subunit AcrB